MNRLKFLTAIILSAMFIFGMFIDSAEAAGKKIFINTASRLLMLYDGDVKIGVFPLGLGKVSTPTPTGYYKILEKIVNPIWTDPDSDLSIESGPDNPLGYRWMQIQGNYGIHGTNVPESIGGYVSHGCIRMREEDVEKVFDAVEVGTPVEINYNRVVVEKDSDDNVVYYIYPDGYGMQDVTVNDVAKWLEPFGVLPFESDYNISQKISASDGQPTIIGKPYNIEVNGQIVQPADYMGVHYSSKAVLREGITYIPIPPITKAMHIKLKWNKTESSIESKFGKVVCYQQRDQIYCNADDAMILFNIEGGLTTNKDGDRFFKYNSMPENIPTVDKPTQPVPNVDEPKNPATTVDEPKTPTTTVDEPKTPTTTVDEPKTPPTTIDKPEIPETVYENEDPAAEPEIPETVADKNNTTNVNETKADKIKAKESKVVRTSKV